MSEGPTMPACDHPYFDTPFLALAHRGGGTDAASLARENSLFAFTRAVELGYRYVETDVHATTDGVLVAFHDEALDRVTDASGRIAELGWDTVRRARIGGIDPIPTLAEILTALPDTRINIDAKSDGAVAPLVEHIARFEAWERVCVTSFGVRRLHRVRRLLRRRLGPHRPVATAASQLGIGWTRLMPVLPRWLHSAGGAFQVPVEHALGPVVLRIVTERFVATAHAAGQQVHAWTINDAAEMNRLLDLGVDGLISDRIDTLKAVLTARGLWGRGSRQAT